jgi:hypothetical protein
MDNEHFVVHYPQFLFVGTGEFLLCNIETENKRYSVFSAENLGFHEKRIRIYG